MNDNNRSSIIVVGRHPEKDKDPVNPRGISVYGAMQAFAAARALGQIIDFDHLGHSGVERAEQAAHIAKAALYKFELPIDKFHGLFFGPTEEETVGKGGSLTELPRVRQHGSTVADALAMSKFAQAGRLCMLEELAAIATRLEELGKVASYCIGHTMWLELAVLDPFNVPYALNECDSVLYRMEGTKPVSSRLIRAPMPGNAY